MNDSNLKTSRPTRVFFVLAQLVLVAVLLVWGGSRARALRMRTQLPTLRSAPLSVLPTYDLDVVVTDDQLASVLKQLVPRNRQAETKINHVDHALRFWGAGARFSDPDAFSGDQMRDLLADNERFTEFYGSGASPLLIETPEGVRVRVQEGLATSSHVDHTMASLAEVGTPLEFPVRTASRHTTFGEMVRQSLRDFSLNQVEYEWSALTYALLLPPHCRWVTSEGQEIDFDVLARRIMRQDMPQGVCFGNHRLYALTIMLRVDDQQGLLSPVTRAEIFEYLKDMTNKLVAHQHADGFWNSDWPRETPASSQPSEIEGDRLPDRILATGHALEWWAMAPEELHPPRETLTRAAQWLCQTIGELDEDKIEEYYTYLSHAGRALALWRSRQPAELAPTL